MLKDDAKFTQTHLKSNFIFNTIDGAMYSLGMILISFNTIFPVFLRKLGGTNLLISLIPFITIAGSSIPQLFAAHYVKGLGRKKPYVVLFGLLQRLPWVIIGVVCFTFGQTTPKLVIATALLMFCMFAIATGFVSPAWFVLFSKLTPVHFRGRALSIRSIIGQLLGIVGAFFAAHIIGRIAFPYNYSLLFILAFIFVMISFAALTLLKEQAETVKAEKSNFRIFLSSVPEILRSNKDFRYFVISRALFELSLSVPAFYSVYAVKQFGLSDAYAGIFTTITSIAYVSVNFIFGSLGDRKGYKLNILIGLLTSVAAAAAALVINSIFFFYFIFILTAISQSTKDLSISSITVEFCKAEERATYIAISSVIMIPVSLVVLAMGTIADLFGYKYLFLLTILSSILAAALLYFKVRDPRKMNRGLKRS
jgi:Sugar phosphate permease